jgi:hypothetical protein
MPAHARNHKLERRKTALPAVKILTPKGWRVMRRKNIPIVLIAIAQQMQTRGG